MGFFFGCTSVGTWEFSKTPIHYVKSFYPLFQRFFVIFLSSTKFFSQIVVWLYNSYQLKALDLEHLPDTLVVPPRPLENFLGPLKVKKSRKTAKNDHFQVPTEGHPKTKIPTLTFLPSEHNPELSKWEIPFVSDIFSKPTM